MRGVASASKSDEALAVTGAVRGWILRNGELFVAAVHVLPSASKSPLPLASLIIDLSKISIK